MKNKAVVDFVKKYNPKSCNFFCKLRLSNSHKAVLSMFEDLTKNPCAIEKMKTMYFPDDSQMLGRKLQYNNRVSLEELLVWDEKIILQFRELMNIYLSLRCQYEYFYMSEQYMDAWKILGEIEKKCGYSFWLIEQQFGVLYCMNATMEVESLLEYYKKLSRGPLIRNILLYLNWRKDPDINCQKYNKYIERLLEDVHVESIVVKYLKSKLLIQKEKSKSMYKLQLQLEEAFSLIDLYEVLVDALFFLLYEENEQIDIRLLRCMKEQIDDFRLSNMLAYLEGNVFEGKRTDRQYKVYSLLETYSECNWEKTEQILESYLEIYPHDFMMNHLYVKCLVYQNKSLNRPGAFWKSFYSLYTMRADIKLLKAKFDYYIKQYYGTKWQYKILSIWNRKINGRKDDFSDFMAVCYDEMVTPIFSRIIDGEAKGQLLDKMKNVCPTSVAVLNFRYNLNNSVIHVNESMKDFYLQVCHFGFKEDRVSMIQVGKEALEYIEQGGIQQSHSAYYYYKERICRYLYSGMLREGNLQAAIDLYGRLFIEREFLVNRFDLENLMTCVEKMCADDDADLNFMRSIYVPVVYHCKYGDENPEKVIMAYRQFLLFQGTDYLDDWMDGLSDIAEV